MIRFLIVALFVILFLILSIPLLIAEWIIGRFNPALKDKSSLAIVNWAFRQVLRLAGTRVIVLGEENVPKDTAVLYVGNHRSYFDIVMTYVRVPRPTGYIAKKEMLKWPLLTNWMRNLHCLFLDRDDIKQGLKTILAGVEKVKNGISICIFPEGTRNKVPDTFLPFHEGSFKIAEKGNVPVVPMSIVNSAAIFEDHMPKIKPATVIIEYCRPIYINELDKETRKKLGSYVSGIISERYFINKKAFSDQL
ncbi:MAG TPA: 1-acyl-sn-glycerol-3-phosphate acyltransferase [Candidatus Acetatifactor stercoripullorum]|uniref:1-acyl-sn-glycerol-3-phosphate acyltransferase n=1 Tax=Candidatus Acetatifactor stercoripullorum TaxID=2838414 RepID=A0A9D1R5X8_9FIRM|nr:lysophospholipid acyltransferase family protein [Candidatus Acetatifactor stercoripullorum]HIW80677.1 1-acyl-sn-glycerol-3-phosphate acyltransferase [Candidatus Acetatifactor stercoripullorum]